MKNVAVIWAVVLLGGCTNMPGMSPERIPYQGRKEPLLTAPGDNYVAIDGGECFGHCPGFEIYVFETGRVVFRGGRYTAQSGIATSQIEPGGYLELMRLLEQSGALSHRAHFNCMTDHPTFNVVATEGTRIRISYLNYGCNSDAKILDRVVDEFIRVSNSAGLIGKAQ